MHLWEDRLEDAEWVHVRDAEEVSKWALPGMVVSHGVSVLSARVLVLF